MGRLRPDDLDEDSLYRRVLREHMPLDHEEFSSLFLKYKSGDREAKSKLMLSNFGLVLMVYNNLRWKYQIDRVMNLEEVASYGFEGIKKALENFDIGRGLKFSTYATFWIKEKIVSAVSKEYNRMKGLIDLRKNSRPKNYRDHHDDLYFEDILSRAILSNIEKKILRLKFVYGMNCIEISKALGRKIGGTRVWQIANAAIKRLRTTLSPIEQELMLEK